MPACAVDPASARASAAARGRPRRALAALARAAPAAAPRAQSLLELYDAAHAYDATYLAARALAESAPYRVEQAEALLRPSVVAGSQRRARSRPTRRSARTPAATRYGADGRAAASRCSTAPNSATIAQAERSLESSLADLDTAEQDLILRVSQAYFDVLGAQDTLPTHARQQGGDRRAARLGQAQLRGRHRDHHRHPRGAGALRPGDGAGDRRRERPA